MHSFKKRKISKRGTHPNSLKNLHNGKQGRPKGSKNHDGLGAVLTMLKDLVSEEKNLKKLREHFQILFDQSPAGFCSKFILPLLPKNINLDPGAIRSITITGDYAVQEKQNDKGKKDD
jgi:hypothetical protein